MLHRGQCLQRRLPVDRRLAEVDYLRVPEHDADFVTGCDGLADEILRPADRLQDGLAVHGPAHVDAEHHDTAAEAVLPAAEIPPGRYLCQPGRSERAPDPVSHLLPPQPGAADESGQALGFRTVGHALYEGLEPEFTPGPRLVCDDRQAPVHRDPHGDVDDRAGFQRADLGELAVENPAVVPDFWRRNGSGLLIYLNPDRILVRQDGAELVRRPRHGK